MKAPAFAGATAVIGSIDSRRGTEEEELVRAETRRRGGKKERRPSESWGLQQAERYGS